MRIIVFILIHYVYKPKPKHLSEEVKENLLILRVGNTQLFKGWLQFRVINAHSSDVKIVYNGYRQNPEGVPPPSVSLIRSFE